MKNAFGFGRILVKKKMNIKKDEKYVNKQEI